ncbi:UNVERIFIED_CONTAM: hypothetical protein K2H54_058252 [Gekko kuhli]
MSAVAQEITQAEESESRRRPQNGGCTRGVGLAEPLPLSAAPAAAPHQIREPGIGLAKARLHHVGGVAETEWVYRMKTVGLEGHFQDGARTIRTHGRARIHGGARALLTLSGVIPTHGGDKTFRILRAILTSSGINTILNSHQGKDSSHSSSCVLEETQQRKKENDSEVKEDESAIPKETKQAQEDSVASVKNTDPPQVSQEASKAIISPSQFSFRLPSDSLTCPVSSPTKTEDTEMVSQKTSKAIISPSQFSFRLPPDSLTSPVCSPAKTEDIELV